MPTPSIETIHALLSNYVETSQEWRDKIDEHLTKLNGQVAKNTQFRVSIGAVLKTIGAIGAIIALATPIAVAFLKS